MVKVIFALVMSGLLFGCRSVDVWSDGYPREGAELKADGAKKAELDKFAIYDGRARLTDSGGYIQTQKDKGTDKYYSINSFSPVMERVSPATTAKFERMHTLRVAHYVTQVVTLVGAISYGMVGDKQRRVADGLFWGGLMGSIGVGFANHLAFEDATTEYHKDLNSRIYGSGRVSTGPRFGFKLAHDLKP